MSTISGKTPVENAPGTNAAFPGRSIPFLWIFAVACLVIAVRIPHLGHLLAWDEAWNLGALKSLAGNGTLFIEQFWRHPPIYMTLGLLLAPLRAGFEYRMELLSLLLSAGALVVFMIFVSRILGRRIAVFTGIAYALLPGPVFFDTWIKRDPVVTLFCTLALWAFCKKKEWLAGLLLGLAMLGKETAVFFFITIFLITLFRFVNDDRWKKLLLAYMLALAACGWWYLLLARGGSSYLSFFLGNSTEAQGFAEPWWYYPAKLRFDLGYTGLPLMLLGLAALLPLKPGPQIKAPAMRYLGNNRLIPVYILLPAYSILSLSHGKPPWLTTVLQPALALLVAIGWAFLLQCLDKCTRGGCWKSLLTKNAFSCILLAAVLGLPLTAFNYNKYFNTVAPSHFTLSEMSYELAAIVNKELIVNDRLLIMPMWYRNNPMKIDPILAWRLTTFPQSITFADPGDYESFLRIVKSNKIHWVLMSPRKGDVEEMILSELLKEYAPEGRRFSRGLLIRLAPIWQDSAAIKRQDD